MEIGRSLTQTSLERLLASLDPDREAAGQKYETLRKGVVRFFEWRGCRLAEEYADEAIDRTARKLEAGEEIRDVYPYVIGVARYVLKEAHRDQEKKRLAFRELRQVPTPSRPDADPRLACLETCLEALSAENRDLLVTYYRDEKRAKIDNRKDLAERLGIPLATLRMRAHRLREKLEICAHDCTKRKSQ